RDEEVWFVDGNIVLQAHGVAFRVYQDIFALNPEVFAGMFSVPQPATVETFDDCPVIHLSDNPNDLRLLLRVIFIDKEHVLYRRDTQFPFSVVEALVHLAHKYGIKDILDNAL
ncbi:hypothetical protein FOMPIDRAFT_1105957, partial [Fomitopsis schrenkii]